MTTEEEAGTAETTEDQTEGSGPETREPENPTQEVEERAETRTEGKPNITKRKKKKKRKQLKGQVKGQIKQGRREPEFYIPLFFWNDCQICFYFLFFYSSIKKNRESG